MAVAEGAISYLNTLCPNSKPIIVGGAPRDWIRNVTCNDVDIYVTDSEETYDYIQRYARSLERNASVVFDGSAGCTFISRIINVISDDVDIPTLQFILVESTEVNEVFGRLGCSLSEIMWEPPTTSTSLYDNPGKFRTTSDYRYSVENKVIFFRSNKFQRANRAYIQKMMNRFPDFRFYFKGTNGEARVIEQHSNLFDLPFYSEEERESKVLAALSSEITLN